MSANSLEVRAAGLELDGVRLPALPPGEGFSFRETLQRVRQSPFSSTTDSVWSRSRCVSLFAKPHLDGPIGLIVVPPGAWPGAAFDLVILVALASPSDERIVGSLDRPADRRKIGQVAR